jgi:hypothetical protein
MDRVRVSMTVDTDRVRVDAGIGGQVRVAIERERAWLGLGQV